MRFNPFFSLLTTISYVLRGRLHFPGERIGEVLTMEDGKVYTVFRQAIVDPSPDQPKEPGVTFKVRFRVARMSTKQNKLFSLLPIPFFVGLPGFRSKLWMLNEASSECQGIYQWDTMQDAENYASSFAMKFMTLRSIPGSVSYEIFLKQGPMQNRCSSQAGLFLYCLLLCPASPLNLNRLSFLDHSFRTGSIVA